MKRVFMLCLFAIFLLGTFFSPQPGRTQEADGVPGAPLAGQSQEAASQWVAVARGVVEPTGGLMRLAAQREGLIEAVMVNEGDHVTKGQELARLTDKAAQVQIGIATAELDQSRTQEVLARLRAEAAQAEADRIAPLARADALPRRQVDEATRAARIAAIELDIAGQAVLLAQERLKVQQADADAHIVRAPVDGVIVRSTARPGDGTSTSTVTEMFLLAPDGPLVLKAQLDEQFVGLVDPGQRAEILRERDDGSRLTGTVIRVAPVFGSLVAAQPGQAGRGDEARTLEISVRLDGPDDQIRQLVLGQRLIARISE
ncbi:MAG: efflux RND transporter periplasmic adaptor subunit [Paracoccus sp. (in: a-proteobacteria)]|uniref:efflux RND transporter periplasmic adaptor subunit n=1 Tax=Paracoccus sp. TaxID=267 RepID=UPI00391DAABD